MAKNLSLTLEGVDANLSDALEDVRDAAGQAASALEKAEDKISGIADDMTTSAKAAEKLQEKLQNVGESGALASSTTSKLERSVQDLAAKSVAAGLAIDNVSESEGKLTASSVAASDAVDQLEEQMSEARNDAAGLSGSISAETVAALAMVGANLQAANSVESLGDEADRAGDKLAKASSMAGLLSLQSSALSINVGAFTIALRNLTTQVPLLVTSLGNLSTAFVGVASAIGLFAGGGLAVVLGGAVAEVENLAGEAATLEEKMQAIQAIGKEFMRMLRRAIDPLTEITGVTEVFRSLLEGIAKTVNVFSQAIAESWENGPLRTAIGNLSTAWMQSIDDISGAFQDMTRRLGVPLSEVIADGIRSLDDFITFVTNVSLDIMSIIGEVTGSIGSFARELMELGRNIAAGLAPILGLFFDIVSSIARELNSLNDGVLQMSVLALGLTAILIRFTSVFLNLLGPLSTAIDLGNKFGETFVDSITKADESLVGLISRIKTRLMPTMVVASEMSIFAGDLVTDEIRGLEAVERKLDDYIAKTRLATWTNFKFKGSLTSLRETLLVNTGIMDAYSKSVGKVTGESAILGGAMKKVAKPTAALGIALAAVIALLAVSSAALIKIGQSSKDTDDIIKNLKNSLVSLAELAIPRFVDMGNVVIDIFNGIVAFGEGLVNLIKPVAEVLGLVDENASGAGMSLGVMISLMDASIKVWEAIGNIFRIVGGLLNLFFTIIGEWAGVLLEVILVLFESFIEGFLGIEDAGGGLMSTLSSIGSVLMDLIKLIEPAISMWMELSMVVNDILIGAVEAVLGPLSTLAKITGKLYRLTNPLLLLWTLFGDKLLNVVVPAIMTVVDVMRSAKDEIGGFFDDMFSDLISGVRKLWNDTLGGETIIPEISIGGIENTPFDGLDYGPVKFPTIGGDGGGGDGGAVSGSSSGVPEESKGTKDDIVSGFDSVSDLLDRDSGEANFEDLPTNFEYNDKTLNNFKQDISANPEDKAQISRIAKDAMEEANSFARRQQGGQ